MRCNYCGLNPVSEGNCPNCGGLNKEYRGTSHNPLEQEIHIGPWSIWIYILILLIIAFLGGEFMGAGANICLLMMAATWITWTRLPRGLQEIITHPIIGGITDVLVGWVGWFILPNSVHAKVGFIMFHIAISLALFWEHARLRGRVKWPWQYVLDTFKTSTVTK